MTSPYPPYIKEFRQKLEAADCALVFSANDCELDSWLHRPGLGRLRLLQWCFCQISPTLRDRVKNDNEIKEKAIVELARSHGIEHNSVVILGGGQQKEQYAMWYRLFLLLDAARESESNSTSKNLSASHAKLRSSLIRSKEFNELLHHEVKLLPLDLHISPKVETYNQLVDQLKAVKLELEELQASVENDESSDGSEEIDKTLLPISHYKEAFNDHLMKIRECYNHLSNSVFPAMKQHTGKREKSIIEDVVKNLADKIIGLVQMLKDIEAIKQVTSRLEEECLADSDMLNPSELHEYVSKSHTLVSEALSLMRMHNIT